MIFEIFNIEQDLKIAKIEFRVNSWIFTSGEKIPNQPLNDEHKMANPTKKIEIDKFPEFNLLTHFLKRQIV